MQRYGGIDPTTRLADGSFLHGTLTPDGPGTLWLRWSADPAPVDECELTVDAWGPGAAWLVDRVDHLTGRHDAAVEFDDAHPVVRRSLAATRAPASGPAATCTTTCSPRCSRSGSPAVKPCGSGRGCAVSWATRHPARPTSCRACGSRRRPASLHRRPAWWFHPLGVEAKRARALTEVARHADHCWAWAASGSDLAAAQLALIPGIGPWTVGSVLGPALGDPDAVPVGDFHFPHAVAWALAGEPRADDDRMLELLEPYRGQRGRVLAAVLRTAGAAPAFGPRRRILPIARL